MLRKILKHRELIRDLGTWSNIASPHKFYINKAYHLLLGTMEKVEWFMITTCSKATPKAVFLCLMIYFLC